MNMKSPCGHLTHLLPLISILVGSAQSWSVETTTNTESTRSSFLKKVAAVSCVLAVPMVNEHDVANADTTSAAGKMIGISNDKLKEIVTSDMIDRQFLVSAKLTREVYDESALFTDEIDTYTLPKWIKGTQALFVTSGSSVRLVGDVDVSTSEASFRFDEDLMFNIPFKPVVELSGKVVLARSTETGLITSYKEIWDQSVITVLKSAKFGG